MFLIILIKSLIIGGLVGVGVGAGAARMFHAPTTQGMGAFRTLGELNSCEGDPASHFSFGLGFFFNAWASSVAAGAFTQDVDHRIIPNWGAAALMIKNRNVGETLHDPKRMAIACGVIGMIVVTFLNLTASSVPEALQVTAVKVLVPAANLLVNTVMPVIFWLAAIDAGKKSGFWATVAAILPSFTAFWASSVASNPTIFMSFPEAATASTAPRAISSLWANTPLMVPSD